MAWVFGCIWLLLVIFSKSVKTMLKKKGMHSCFIYLRIKPSLTNLGPAWSDDCGQWYAMSLPLAVPVPENNLALLGFPASSVWLLGTSSWSSSFMYGAEFAVGSGTSCNHWWTWGNPWSLSRSSQYAFSRWLRLSAGSLQVKLIWNLLRVSLHSKN